MKKVKCKKCGTLNDRENIFCAVCESILTNTDSGQAYIRKRKRERLRTGILIFLVVVVAFIFIATKYYAFLLDKVQGIWSGSQGDLILSSYGEADATNTSFIPEGTYLWKVRMWDKLILARKDDPKMIFEYKINLNSDGEVLELTEVNNPINIYEFTDRDFLIYTVQ